MKLKLNLLILLSIANSAHAISFRDYYYGNEDLGLPPRGTEIYEAVARKSLNLCCKGLTDLIDFDEEHVRGLNAVRDLRLNHNQLTSLPANIGNMTQLRRLNADYNQLTTIPETLGSLAHLFDLDLSNNQLNIIPETIGNLAQLRTLNLGNNELTYIPETIGRLKELTYLNLFNNPLQMNTNELRELLQIPYYRQVYYGQLRVDFFFKFPEQEKAEKELFNAITRGNVHQVQQQFTAIPNDGNGGKIDVTKIRDEAGNNLLHSVIKSAAAHLQAVKDPKERADINDRYMKIFSIILGCGEECVQKMLYTPDAMGEQVVDEIFNKLGPESPLFKAVVFGGEITEEEKAAAVAKKEKEELAEKEQKAQKTILIERLNELADVLQKNNLTAPIPYVQDALTLIKTQPYTTDTLTKAFKRANSLNRTTEILYFERPTTISFLLDPILAILQPKAPAAPIKPTEPKPVPKQSQWTTDHQAVADHLNHVVAFILAGNQSRADKELKQAVALANKMKKAGFNLKAPNAENQTLEKQANGMEGIVGKLPLSLARDMKELINLLI